MDGHDDQVGPSWNLRLSWRTFGNAVFSTKSPPDLCDVVRKINSLRFERFDFLDFRYLRRLRANARNFSYQIHTVQYSAVQCSAVQCSAVQCSAVQCSTVQYSTVQYNRAQYNTLFNVDRSVFPPTVPSPWSDSSWQPSVSPHTPTQST